MTAAVQPARRNISRELQARVFYRDRWLCRWCKKPVIFAPALKYLQRRLDEAGFNDLAYWRLAYHRRGAPLLDELAAVLDHVNPHSAGGPGDADNLATACNRCNMKKSNSEPMKWERDNPLKAIKGKYGEPVNWDGLSSLFLFLAQEKYAPDLTKTENEWVEALKHARAALER